MTCWPPVVTSMSSASTSMPSAAITSTMQSLTSSMPSVGPYCSARARGVGRDARHERGDVLGGNVRGVGQAAGERDHLGARGDRHQVAHRRGLHDLRAAREQPGVALEVARAVDRDAAHATGFAAGARAPWRLVYRHAASGTLATHGLPPRPPPGRRPRRRHRHPARSCRRCWSARWRPRDVGLDFDGTDFAFLEAWPFLLGVLVAGRGARLRRPPRGPRRRGPAAAAVRCCSASRSCSARCWPPARSPTTASDSWPGWSSASPCAALGFAAARSLFARVRRRLDAEAAAALPLYGEGAALVAAGLRCSSRRSRCS